MSASPTPSDPIIGNTAIAIALGAVVAIVATFHVGAVIAVFLSGHGVLHASLADSGAALVHVVSHGGLLTGAWSTTPQPVVFWLVEIVLFVAVTAVSAKTYERVSHRRSGASNALGIRKHAGFAKVRDLRSLIIEHPTVGRLTLGRLRAKLLAAEPQASLAVIGPTGCGKTAGFAIPALLEWQGPIIATSVKADLIASTIAHRRSRGRVWVYDPTSCSGQLSSSWSPLSSCDTWQGAQRMAAWLCEAAQPKLDSVSDGDYWYTQARKALAPYLFAAAADKRPMADVVTWIDAEEQDQVEAILREAAQLDQEINLIAGSAHGDQLRKAATKKIRPRLVAAMRERLSSSGDERLAAAVAGTGHQMAHGSPGRAEREHDRPGRSLGVGGNRDGTLAGVFDA